MFIAFLNLKEKLNTSWSTVHTWCMALHIWLEQNCTWIRLRASIHVYDNMYDSSWRCPFVRGLQHWKPVPGEENLLNMMSTSCMPWECVWAVDMEWFLSRLSFMQEFCKFYRSLSFIEDVLLTDKQKSVASGVLLRAVVETELQEDSCLCSGNLSIHSRTWRCKQTLLVLTCLPFSRFSATVLITALQFSIAFHSTWQNPLRIL